MERLKPKNFILVSAYYRISQYGCIHCVSGHLRKRPFISIPLRLAEAA